MRHTKNSHFITLFHTSLHPRPCYTHVYAVYAHVTERVVTLYSGAYTRRSILSPLSMGVSVNSQNLRISL